MLYCPGTLPFIKHIAPLVMMLLAIVDPEGTRRRKMNKFRRRIIVVRSVYTYVYIWWSYAELLSGSKLVLAHIDGYDKLKPFGFPIHACIDG